MKTLALSAAALLATTAFCSAQMPYTGGIDPKNPGMGEVNSYIEDQVFEIVNRYRKDKGLVPFQRDARLTEVARQNLLRMKGQGWVDSREYCVRQEEVLAVMPRLIRYGENYSFTFPYKENVAGKIVQEWLKEERFQWNLINDYQLAGIIAACNREGDRYVVMNFAKIKPLDGKQDPGSNDVQPTDGPATDSSLQQPQQAESTEVEDIYGLSMQ